MYSNDYNLMTFNATKIVTISILVSALFMHGYYAYADEIIITFDHGPNAEIDKGVIIKVIDPALMGDNKTNIITVAANTTGSSDTAQMTLSEFMDSGTFFYNYLNITDNVPVNSSPTDDIIETTVGEDVTIQYGGKTDTITVTDQKVETMKIEWDRVVIPDNPDCVLHGGDNENGGEGDGICDNWEDPNLLKTGIGLNITAVGGGGDEYIYPCKGNHCPSPDKKDIFVEIDYMRGHFPDLDAIEMIIHSFNDTLDTQGNFVSGPQGYHEQIQIHFQVDEMAVDFMDLIPFPGFEDSMNYQGYDQVKGEKFGTITERDAPNWETKKKNKHQVFHYALFADKRMWGGSTTGIAEVVGNDIMITLGAAGTEGVGSTGQQAGTLMHELGHNLGLNHGGNESVQCKPNYFSVMSYARQFIDQPGDIKLDFSSDLLDTITEGSQTETNAFPAYQDNTQSIIFSCPARNISHNPNEQVDWDCSGGFNTPSNNNNLNNMPECRWSPWIPTPTGETFKGFDDWSGLIFDFGGFASQYEDGFGPDLSQVPITGQTMNDTKRKLSGSQEIPMDERSNSEIAASEESKRFLFADIEEPSLETLTLIRVGNMLSLTQNINDLSRGEKIKTKPYEMQELEKLAEMKEMSKPDDKLRPPLMKAVFKIIDDINHNNIKDARDNLKLLDATMKASLSPDKYQKIQPKIQEIVQSYDKSLVVKKTDIPKGIPSVIPKLDKVNMTAFVDSSIVCSSGEVKKDRICTVMPAPVESLGISISIAVGIAAAIAVTIAILYRMRRSNETKQA